jgi:hypothetical protein
MRLAALVLLIAACSTGAVGSTADPAGPMAAALVEVATNGNTFGGEPVFAELLVLDHTDPTAGGGGGELPPPGGEDEFPRTPPSEERPLTRSERAAVEAALGDLGTVTWIDDADEWRTGNLDPVLVGSAILGVGEPVFYGDDAALVPVSLWCGGLCGTWLTYRVDLVDGDWVVVDVVGPVMIS